MIWNSLTITRLGEFMYAYRSSIAKVLYLSLSAYIHSGLSSSEVSELNVYSIKGSPS